MYPVDDMVKSTFLAHMYLTTATSNCNFNFPGTWDFTCCLTRFDKLIDG